MSKTWKWILGIFLVLVGVASLVAIGFAWQVRAHFMAAYGSIPMHQNWNGPMMDRGFHPLGGGFFLFGEWVKLALFFGLLYGAYWLGRRNARIVLDAAPAAPVAEVSSPEAAPAAPTPEAETPPASRKRAK